MPSGRGRRLAAAQAALRFLPALLALAAFWRVDDARLSLAAGAAAVPLFLWAARASRWWSAALPFGAALRLDGVPRRGGLSAPARFLLLLVVLALLGALAARLGFTVLSGDWRERAPRAEEQAAWSTGHLFRTVGGFAFEGDDARRFRLRCALTAGGEVAGRSGRGDACFAEGARDARGLAVSVLHGPVSDGLVPTAAVYEVRAGRTVLVDRLRMRALARDAERPGRLLGRIGLLLVLGLLVWTLAPFLPPERASVRPRAPFRLPEN